VEVIGSNPIAPTIVSYTYRQPAEILAGNLRAPKLGSIVGFLFSVLRGTRTSREFRIDGFNGAPNSFGNNLGIHVGSGFRSRVPQHALHILERPHLIMQAPGGNRATDHLEGQFRQARCTTGLEPGSSTGDLGAF
jgi:hypothetical protein